MAFGLDTFSEVDEASPLSSKYQTMAQVRPMDHSVAFGLDACSEVDNASTLSSKYRTMAQVRPKDESIALIVAIKKMLPLLSLSSFDDVSVAGVDRLPYLPQRRFSSSSLQRSCFNRQQLQTIKLR